MVATGESIEGWFEDTFGKSPSMIVKDLRKKRRVHKAMAPEIDEAIKIIRLTKAAEVEQILNSLGWADKHMSTIKSLGVSDKDLKALRKFGDAREVSLRQACLQWENANEVISKLSSIEGDFEDSTRAVGECCQTPQGIQVHVEDYSAPSGETLQQGRYGPAEGSGPANRARRYDLTWDTHPHDGRGRQEQGTAEFPAIRRSHEDVWP